MSYNPSYRDHQNLLQEVANKELTLIKEEKHLNRVTTKMFSRVTEDEKEVSRFVRQHIKSVIFTKGMQKVTLVQDPLVYIFFPLTNASKQAIANESMKRENYIGRSFKYSIIEKL
jgi:hypothetical protein